MGKSSKITLADSYNCFVRNWHNGTASDRADTRGDLTGANIAGIEHLPRGPIDLDRPTDDPLFTMRLTRGADAVITGVSYRWIFRGSDHKSYRMTDPAGNDLFEFKPSARSVVAILNTPTRQLLKRRGINNGKMICRAISPVFRDKVFSNSVSFV